MEIYHYSDERPHITMRFDEYDLGSGGKMAIKGAPSRRISVRLLHGTRVLHAGAQGTRRSRTESFLGNPNARFRQLTSALPVIRPKCLIVRWLSVNARGLLRTGRRPIARTRFWTDAFGVDSLLSPQRVRRLSIYVRRDPKPSQGEAA